MILHISSLHQNQKQVISFGLIALCFMGCNENALDTPKGNVPIEPAEETSENEHSNIPEPSNETNSNTSTDTDTDTGTQNNEEEREENNNSCFFPLPARFLSTDEMEVGLGPDGVVLGYWSIHFEVDGSFMWSYSDIGQMGTYTCFDGNILGITTSENEEFQGIYDQQSDMLNWENIQYERDISY